MPKITLAERAVQKVVEIIFQKPSAEREYILGLRVAIQGGGCSGFKYNLEFAKKGDVLIKIGLDQIFEFEGRTPDGSDFKLKVYVDPVSMLYLEGTTIDYEEALEGSGFKFDNPGAQEKCRCGQSFRA